MTIPNFSNILKTDIIKKSRGEDTKQLEGVTVPLSIGLYTVDSVILNHLQRKIKPVVSQDNKQIQVPVIYGNPERWKSVQLDGEIRDKNGKILLPIIMIRRTSMQKGTLFSPVNKYNRYVFKTGWNPRNIYDRFSAVNNIKPSEIYHSSMLPDYYDITYEAMVWTEYMEQMNKIIENISFESHEYWGDRNNYKFLTTIDNFQQTTDLPSNNNRLVRNSFNVEVRAYLLPEYALDKNGNRISTSRLEFSPKKVVFKTEVIKNL
jgi:hypothetical protein